MNFVGIDLHQKTISLCLVDQERKVLAEFLALDMPPQAYRPSKRQRAHLGNGGQNRPGLGFLRRCLLRERLPMPVRRSVGRA